ncbi:hypothetical protein GPECTOR_249g616 [Gonium pectorale]|uniref:Amino acid permease/ SLC12A domain-containing protein n=1 Tax=Gonium pectorale TaxID=33097 RepID=A0A150FWE5_GONPE|nr:hypothetical protein GPECTOR_249g616 [Gonium pectorale]|eukprot:KXZ41898.1 hypothetical protein GPECTOR_249g616 [Gonium pectorale]
MQRVQSPGASRQQTAGGSSNTANGVAAGVFGGSHGRQRRGAGGGGSRAGYYKSRAGKWDEVKLWQMGYRQELRRSFTLLNNLAICTSVLSFYAVADTYGTQGMAYGGPVSVIWGWVLCSVFSLIVALCLAELLSAYPTTGGIYYWSWVMAPVRHRTILCWMAGWLNLLGQVAFTAGLEYALAKSVASVVAMHTADAWGAGGLVLSRPAVLGVLFGMLTLHACLNSISSSVTAYTNTLSFFWHILATTGLCAALLLLPRRLNSAEYVFAAWTPNSDVHGIKSPAYTFLMGLLMAQWIIMGYDASIHVVEETIDAERAGSVALVGSVAITCGLGFVLLLCLTFAMQSMTNILRAGHGGDGQDAHNAITRLLWDVFRSRYGSGIGALGLSYVPLVGLFFCANASLAANARMAFAFSRDGAMPGARLWRRLDARSRLPVAACWLMALLAGLLAAPCIFNELLFDTISAGSVVALSLSYGIPISLRIFHNPYSFLPGPFSLGRASKPLAVLACAWILLTSVVFVLPTSYPVTAGSANYTAALVAAVLAMAAVLFYAPGFGGRHWFTGPAPNID